jgi:AraC-like DNA-binding protein
MEAVAAPGGATSRTDFHAHHAIQVTLSLGGQFELRTQGRTVTGAAAIAPDESHVFSAQGRVALLFVEPESQSGRAIAKAFLQNSPLTEIPLPPIADLVAKLTTASCPPMAEDAVLESLGRALVSRLAGAHDGPPHDARIRNMIAHAASHLDGPVTLASAARIAGLSPSRARHLFVEQTGLPFRTYLLWIRIVKAVGLFSSGSSLTVAAHEAGFSDSAHFSRTFRRMFGIAAASLRIT